MERLIWKEFRESLWMLVAILLAPMTTLLYSRIVMNARAPWPIVIIMAVIPFAMWGGSRMPHEREAGRITLQTLPISPRQVWALKALPGPLLAVMVSAISIWASGLVPDPTNRMGPSIWMIGGWLAQAYMVAFVFSLFSNESISRTMGVVWGVFGWSSLLDFIHADWFSPAQQNLSWTLVAWMLLLSAGVMLARNMGASLRRTAFGAGIAAAIALGAIASYPLITEQRQMDPNQFYGVIYQTLAASPRAQRVARAEFTVAETRSGSHVTGQEMWAWRLDGSDIRKVASGPRLSPLAWTSRGELIYLSERYGEKLAWLMAWNPGSGRSRRIASMVASTRNHYAPIQVAPDPKGNRIAFVRVTSGRLGFGRMVDLWLADLDTGRMHILCPGIERKDVLWRGDWIYLRGDTELSRISPDGGEPQGAHELPPSGEGGME